MKLRRRLKYWLFGYCPLCGHSFPYHGTKVFFPPGSEAFRACCEQGIFEIDNLRLLSSQAEDGTWMFDIGANIGLMVTPILQEKPGVRVLSFEPSPNSIPYLRRTIAGSPYKERWQLVEKAVGEKSGTAEFHLAGGKNAMFEGLRDTARVPAAGCVKVEVTTVDAEWARIGRPRVSVIKCDVEGGESEMLMGAVECIQANRPCILLEWVAANLRAFKIAPETLLSWSASSGFRVHAAPGLAEVHTRAGLLAAMAFTESFLLLPK